MQSHVFIPLESEYVTGELFTPSVPMVARMLFCHGWTSKNTKYLKLAEKLSQLGIQALAINLRGHGDSRYPLEKYSRQDHLGDILAAIDYLNALGLETPLIGLGKSYGGYLMAIASSLRRIDFIIISQPALYPDGDFNFPNSALIKNNPEVFRSRSETVLTNRALSAVSRFDGPLLIIESEHDEEVLDTPKLYIKASKDNINMMSLVIQNTDHPLSRPEWLRDYYNKITSWLQLKNIIN